MNDQEIEQEIQAKGLTAPRVTPDDIEANIASEHYFTAAEGDIGSINVIDRPAECSRQGLAADGLRSKRETGRGDVMETEEQRTLLHILRNPHGWGDEAVREVRIKAAKELERLWRFERCVQQCAQDLNEAVGVK